MNNYSNKKNLNDILQCRDISWKFHMKNWIEWEYFGKISSILPALIGQHLNATHHHLWGAYW